MNGNVFIIFEVSMIMRLLNSPVFSALLYLQSMICSQLRFLLPNSIHCSALPLLVTSVFILLFACVLFLFCELACVCFSVCV